MQRYNPQTIEPKWQGVWEETGIYKTPKNPKDKYYCLVMFPYSSGDLHIGHWYNFGPGDTVARFNRMQGKDVLHPIGFDAFGLPAENAAIKNKIHPAKWTWSNIENMTKQLHKIGAMYDWDKTLETCNSEYYQWTQWLFLKLYEHGLAERKRSIVNWCPKDQTVLANEQVIGEKNLCERCDTPVVQKELDQWFFKITDYADKLLNDLDDLDWPSRVKTMQTNWIGKSSGAEIEFMLADRKETVKVFTTRPDTLFGATYLVMAPEHPLVKNITTGEKKLEVEQYISHTAKMTELDRKEAEKSKSGVFTGTYAINPANQVKIPIWIADYVLMGYGTGAIMAVPAHDERDWEFAKKFDLEIRPVIIPSLIDESNPPREGKKDTFRNTVLGIIYDPKTDRYLTLKWKKVPWISFVTGGVEEGEDRVASICREIKEETGYQNFRLVRSLGYYEAFFFAEHKDVNRKVFAEHFLFELIDDHQRPISKNEEELHEIKWMTPKELENTKINHVEFHMDWQRIKTGIDVFTGDGVLYNSEKYTGMSSSEARGKIVKDLNKKKLAKEKTNFKLRDWLISRQRYWGTPIPIVYCDKCGAQPVPYDKLPVVLPEDVSIEMTGKSPLLEIDSFVNTECPKCHGLAKRETDTMDTFVDSSWYYLRYPNNQYRGGPFDPKAVKTWLPVDHYMGGVEHAILHLLYSRFITKFLHDYSGLTFDEPFIRLTNQGMILGPDGNKMSKSKGNVVNPDDQVSSYGTDSLRLYLMFMGPYDQGGAYDLGGIAGTRRFIERVWRLVEQYVESSELGKMADIDNQAELETKLLSSLNKSIKKVTLDLEKTSFNTAISSMMEFINSANKMVDQLPMNANTNIWREVINQFLQLLAPFAPHVTEELWSILGHNTSIHLTNWPKWDDKLLAEEMINIVVQINGKLRANLQVSPDMDMHEIVKIAQAEPNVAKIIGSNQIKKIIKVPNRLVNFVV